MMLESSSKTGRVGTDDRWLGSAFQIPEATDENDLEAAMVVLRVGTHIDKDEEERSACAGTWDLQFTTNCFAAR